MEDLGPFLTPQIVFLALYMAVSIFPVRGNPRNDKFTRAKDALLVSMSKANFRKSNQNFPK